MTGPMLQGFLSNHESIDKIVDISVEPMPIYYDEARDSINLNFDFLITGLTDKKLIIRFIKVAIYDKSDTLITFRHLNHNGVGTPSIHSIGKYELNGKETLDVFNPFHRFPIDMPISYLRYMFTFYDPETKTEYYYGNITVKPVFYEQTVRLSLPLKGTLTILDGHDYYSHHRRFAMSIVRKITNGKFSSNFSRYGVDFTVLGPDGNTRKMKLSQYAENYDFHFDDVTKFYTHSADVFAPAEGEVVEIVNNLEDLYETPFNLDRAISEDRIQELAGNYVIIKHNEGEYSHLYHLQQGSIIVSKGDKVTNGQRIGKIGFSGSSTTYFHLHYQLMGGRNFLADNPLPFKFSNIVLLCGKHEKKYDELPLDTGDILRSN
ncbi:MAG: M23 family metallopeptidase [Candidatus Thorarchaeota archaeon]|nr:MAG: M23 family metallopeptidase [Candidatus Thorarchaeota archaeon]